MRITQLQWPMAAAASSCISRAPSTPATVTAIAIWQLRDALGQLRIGASNAAVEGRRYATVKAQGAYKIRDSSTIPKKLGAKKSGDSYVIPGNIIYKQRGTIWFPGENCGMGRDHTIFSLVTGYVKYYRDPAKHPKRQYIGVVFDKADKLPYPPHAMRKRRLNMVAVPMAAPEPKPELSASGIPIEVVRQGEGRRPHPRDERVMRLRRDGSYAYAEENWRLGTLVRTEKRKMGSRRVAMRHRRRRAKAIALEMRAEREDYIARRKEALDAQRAARWRKIRAYKARQARLKAEGKGEGEGEGGGGGGEPNAGGEEGAKEGAAKGAEAKRSATEEDATKKSAAEEVKAEAQTEKKSAPAPPATETAAPPPPAAAPKESPPPPANPPDAKE